ncbi:MAG: hypothetical protein IPI00_02380 [Flavobacteriales bacterium]|nr:hypothetical protein [Flavobacteriales bacterium]MBK6946033.1 hypothetical protein [Flavobacteriales bacterium]MBK7239027.1 hypothetical protein [Flavobacteriales bacterium]MBK7296796.1 hypothetical protein [Flavobacteriales bacterium]MBK9536867.1 hypothetical protein [Flavobacteriales bacterium]
MLVRVHIRIVHFYASVLRFLNNPTSTSAEFDPFRQRSNVHAEFMVNKQPYSIPNLFA